VYFAKKGIRVTVADDNLERLLWTRKLWEKIGMREAATFVQVDDWSNLPFKDNSFDLVWNFSSLWHLNEREALGLVTELGRVYKQILFISVYNARQLIHPIYKKFDANFFSKVNENFCKEEYLTRLFHKKLGGADIFQKGYFVTTPWPGLIVKKEELFGGPGLKSHASKLENVGLKENMKTPEYVAYLVNPDDKNKMRSMMFLERLPNFLKKYWAHLAYYIFEKTHN
jgi:hypothetical protein